MSSPKLCITIGTYERLLYGVNVTMHKEKGEQTESVTMENSFIMPAHAGYISAIATGGKFLASGASDDMIKLYDMKRRKEFGVISFQEKSITSLSFYKQSFLFSTGEDGKIYIYRCKDWELVKTLKASKSARINDFSLHPSGRMAISVSKDRTIILWDLSSGRAMTKSKTKSEPLKIKYSTTGNLYALLHQDSKMEVYDIHAEDALMADIQGPLKTHAIVFFNETHLIYGGEDKIIYAYSFQTKETLQIQTEHKLRIRELLVVEILDIHFLISGSSDGGVKIWRIHTTNDKAGLKLDNVANHSVDARITCMAISLV